MQRTAFAAADRQPVKCQKRSRRVPADPVPRPPAVVSERQDANRLGCEEIDDVIGKPLHHSPTSRQVFWDVRDGGTSLGKPADSIDGPFYCGDQTWTEPRSLRLIPARRLLELFLGFRLDEQRSSHSLARRSSRRCRTSSQGRPADSPASTRRPRRSISMAQAFSAASRSSGTSLSSRLSSSSAATSARSLTGSRRASFRSTSRVMIWESTTRRGLALKYTYSYESSSGPVGRSRLAAGR